MHEDIEQLKDKFCITATDTELLRQAGTLLADFMPEFIEKWYAWLKQQEEFSLFFGSNSSNLKRVQEQQSIHWQSFFVGHINNNYIKERRHIGEVHARIGLPNDIYFAGMSIASQLLSDELWNIKPMPANIGAIANALTKHLFLDSYLVIDEIARIQNLRLSESHKAMMEMSTPVTPIWEGILLLPLLGILDSSRTQEIMNKSLSKISEERTKVFILDISGVASVDTAVANQLIKITKATQLMGCSAIISGISPAIARTIVELGVNIGEIKTTSTLRDAFEIALKLINVTVS
ncbi:protoglobin domain-containing protein [Methylobacter sp. S3L5C]|uniref:protoglobin domain-containing protein n=1 Tax=Methylobacter sp. S3L5C TaxID=2839024 RepID=UPI001FAE1468|nr:protoglobin domain-containing protein [Methylobacter sp. S3L5C]UOA06965.1 STAS domain-containing protein [Methylobacter sp. S3L5C]